MSAVTIAYSTIDRTYSRYYYNSGITTTCFQSSIQPQRSLSTNVATQQNVAPAVSEHFLAIERCFEALSKHGFQCHAVLADFEGLKTYKLHRDPAVVGDGRIHLVADQSGRTQTPANADISAEIFALSRGYKRLRGLARTIQTLAVQGAGNPTVLQDIDVLASCAMTELDVLDETIEDLAD